MLKNTTRKQKKGIFSHSRVTLGYLYRASYWPTTALWDPVKHWDLAMVATALEEDALPIQHSELGCHQWKPRTHNREAAQVPVSMGHVRKRRTWFHVYALVHAILLVSFPWSSLLPVLIHTIETCLAHQALKIKEQGCISPIGTG